MINVRTNTLKKYLDNNSAVRLSKSDRAFLSDLARVNIIDSEDAKNSHYKSSVSGAKKRLDKLVEIGVLESHKIYNPNSKVINAYTFKNDKIAKLFGGEKIKIGKRRSGLHDVITSKLYFSAGCPDTFKVESKFNKDEEKLFRFGSGVVVDRDVCFPDAYYISNGEIVLVESDSGQYTQRQINAKQTAWKGYKQVWGRPSGATTNVSNSTVFQY